MDNHQELAARLRDAHSGGQVPPLRPELEPSDAAGAYAVQALNTQFWRGEGRRVTGWKVGLTAKALQVQLGVDQPDRGVLFEDMALSDGAMLDLARVLQPKAEAEIALVMGRDLMAPDATPQHILSAASHALAAIEIADSRIADWNITFADTVADNASAGLYVLGRREVALEGLDLYTCGMVLEVNGEIVSTGVGAACLGDPLISAAWLARTLVRNGESLNAGDVILTGALGPAVSLAPGDRVEAQIGGLGSASLACDR